MPNQPNSQTTIPCLLDALRSADSSVRSYDTKAQISAAILILSINPVIQGLQQLRPEQGANFSIFLSASIFVCVVSFALVLYPTRNPTKALNVDPHSVNYIYYIRHTDKRLLNQLAHDAADADWVSEILFEMRKVSIIRNIKHKRFVWALSITTTVYLLIIFTFAYVALFTTH